MQSVICSSCAKANEGTKDCSSISQEHSLYGCTGHALYDAYFFHAGEHSLSVRGPECSCELSHGPLKRITLHNVLQCLQLPKAHLACLKHKEVCFAGYGRLMAPQHNRLPARFAIMFTSCSAVLATHTQAQGFAIAKGAAVYSSAEGCFVPDWMLPICLDVRHAYTG